MTLSAVNYVAFDCSDAKTLIGIIKVGSTVMGMMLDMMRLLGWDEAGGSSMMSTAVCVGALGPDGALDARMDGDPGLKEAGMASHHILGFGCAPAPSAKIDGGVVLSGDGGDVTCEGWAQRYTMGVL
jgi:hypothetical protein